MTSPEHENAPGGYSEGDLKCHCGDKSSLPMTAVKSTVHAPELPAYVVLVSTREGRYRRRVFLSLHSAVHAAERARERGQDADLVLCELRPVEALIA
ncbi:hypothetical protein SAMN06298212_10572 [Ruaniaceae bacterium KH17]|nr:hypothetical protein SAMN06298212_10572 [Ruaniaceae bacterium KH17]